MRTRMTILALLGIGSMALGGCGGGGTAPPPANARLRMANFAAGAPNADMYGASKLIGANLAFGQVSSYTSMSSGDARVFARQAGTSTTLADNLINLGLNPGTDYTLILMANSPGAYLLGATIDERRTIPSNEVRTRYFHLAPDVADTIQVVLNGVPYTRIDQGDILFPYYPQAPGAYYAVFRMRKDTTVVFAADTLRFTGGLRYTIVLSGLSHGPNYRITTLVDSM